MTNFRLIIGDSRQKMTGLKADYIFTVPPDFAEVGLDPHKTRDYAEYFGLLRDIFGMGANIAPVITIGITDRKFDGGIIAKHAFLIRLFHTWNWKLLSHKIWSKSPKRNLYRLTYTHIMSFAKKKVKQNHPNIYELDVFLAKEQKYEKYSYGMNEEIVLPFILNFTNEGDTILDPFLGSGTTAVVALQNERNCIGIEIDSKIARLAEDRVEQWSAVPRARKFFEEGENFE